MQNAERKQPPIRNPKGAGRKPGSRSGMKQGKRVQSLRERFPRMPLEHMLIILNETDIVPKNTKDKEGKAKMRAQQARKDDMAKAAAPYIHPRLSSVAFKGDNNDPRNSLDLSKLSDEELAAFELIVSKAQVQRIPPELLEGDDPDVDMKILSYDPLLHKVKNDKE
jgi:hypothetical protein